MLFGFRKKLANMSKVLPVVKEDLSRQKFSFKKLKAVAAQHSSQLQSELRVTCSAIATAINTFAQNLPCDGSCVQIRQQFKCKHHILNINNCFLLFHDCFECFSDGIGACATESFGARADWSHGNT